LFLPDTRSVVAMSSLNPVIVGVAGGSGSGKTTVSRAILDAVGADRIAYIQQDSYYRDASHLPPEERVKINFDHPDSLETDLLVEHLGRLQAGEEVAVPTYNFATHSRMPSTERVNPHPVILVEGILIFAERPLQEMFDVKIYVDTEADIRFIRRLQRDLVERGRSINSVIEQYLQTVKPMHEEFVEPSKRHADVIIPRGGHNRVALDMVISRVQSLLSERIR
jgi:uridine kinase